MDLANSVLNIWILQNVRLLPGLPENLLSTTSLLWPLGHVSQLQSRSPSSTEPLPLNKQKRIAKLSIGKGNPLLLTIGTFLLCLPPNQQGSDSHGALFDIIFLQQKITSSRSQSKSGVQSPFLILTLWAYQSMSLDVTFVVWSLEISGILEISRNSYATLTRSYSILPSCKTSYSPGPAFQTLCTSYEEYFLGNISLCTRKEDKRAIAQGTLECQTVTNKTKRS